MHPLQNIEPLKSLQKGCFPLAGGAPVMTRAIPVTTRETEVMSRETPVMTGELEVMPKSIPVVTGETEVMTQEIPVVTRDTKVRTNINYYSTTTHNSKLGTGNYKHPFGWPMVGRQSNPDSYRFGFQGQFAEQDGETGFNAFKERMYEPRSGRWLTIDPIKRDYISGYIGMGNNPIIYKDADGRDIIYLYDPTGVDNHGHTALLIGNDEDGWRLFSKNGYGVLGAEDDVGGLVFDDENYFRTYQEFVESAESNRYSQGGYVKTEPNFDKELWAQGFNNIAVSYNVSNCNCSDFNRNTLHDAGIDLGERQTAKDRYFNVLQYTDPKGEFQNFLQILGAIRITPNITKSLPTNAPLIINRENNKTIIRYENKGTYNVGTGD